MQRINKLDGLRGLFALFVVLFHFNVNNAPAALVNNFFVRDSYIFVDFFFILSGYVISITYDQKLNSISAIWPFIKKRFLRLYPLLLFSTCMYWYFVHPHFDKRNILLALDTLLLTNATPILGSDIGMNYPSWSISSEMISYLAFAACSAVAIKKKKTILIASITAGCFIFLTYQQNYFVTGSFGFIRGLACFNLGYFVFLLATKQFKVPNIIEWLIPFSILGLMYYHYKIIQPSILYQLLVQFMIPISFAIIILVLIKTKGIISKILQTRPLLFLGKISYSIYLNQAFIIGYFIPKLYKWIHWSNEEAKKSICTFALLSILIIYSWATQYFIENQWGKRWNAFLKS